MGKEIERKFLVKGEAWRKGGGKRYRQGYLCLDEKRSIRVRTTPDGAFLTIKGATERTTRSEYEYEIPVADAIELLENHCVRPLIEKDRFRLIYKGLVWEVDEFFGANQGLVIAELELKSEDQAFDKPDWAGEEVTGDPRYYNMNLVAKPYTAW
jgi:adenylate cyclase